MKKINLTVAALVVATPLLVLSITFGGLPGSAQLSSFLFSSNKPIPELVSIAEATLISEAAFLRNFQPSPSQLPPSDRLVLSRASVFESKANSSPTRNWNVPYREIQAEAVFALSPSTGRILYSKNAFSARPVASLTKLITALVVVENLRSDEIITISKAATSVEEKTARLVAGDRLTVHDVLYALLLESGNDAAIALEEHYNTTRAQASTSFVVLMNQKAAALGLASTSFSDSSGLEPQNQSSAFDVVQVLYTVFQNEMLRDILGTRTYSATAQNGTQYRWETSNELLLQRVDVLGGKTGYTQEAGHSLAVVAASPAHTTIITVVLGAQDRERETAALLDWIYAAYQWN